VESVEEYLSLLDLLGGEVLLQSALDHNSHLVLKLFMFKLMDSFDCQVLTQMGLNKQNRVMELAPEVFSSLP
jgi:hypothetical protein